MVFTKYTVQKGKPLFQSSPAVAATGVWADTRSKLLLPFVIMELSRGRDWPLRHRMFRNCFASLRKELEALMGPDELLTAKNTKVFRGKCIALPDAPDYIVMPLAPLKKYVQLSLESVGIRPCRKANRGGRYRGGGSIAKSR